MKVGCMGPVAPLVTLATLALTSCDVVPVPCELGPGVLCVFAGTGEAGLGEEEVPPVESELYLPQDLTFHASGVAYLLDWNNHRVRVVEDDLIRTVIGTGQLGDAPDGDALSVSLNHPTHVSMAPDGTVVMSAWHNSKLVRYDPITAKLTTFCGNGMREFGGDGGPAEEAILDLPVATAFAPDGSLYVMDQANQRVRKIDTAGVITTVVGNGTAGYTGDGGPAVDAMISLPGGQSAPPAGRIETDAAGNLFLADTGNHRIRRVNTEGVIETVAGNGTVGRGGDGGPATEASLSRPSDVAVSADGSFYIADTGNSCVRRVNHHGVISTAVGICGSPGAAGEGGPAREAHLDRPYGVTLDGDGNLYVVDTHNHRVVVVGAG